MGRAERRQRPCVRPPSAYRSASLLRPLSLILQSSVSSLKSAAHSSSISGACQHAPVCVCVCVCVGGGGSSSQIPSQVQVRSPASWERWSLDMKNRFASLPNVTLVVARDDAGAKVAAVQAQAALRRPRPSDLPATAVEWEERR